MGATNKKRHGSHGHCKYKKYFVYLRRGLSGLEDIIKERLNKQASIGFFADLKDKYDNDPDLLSKVTVDDLRSFGMIPEFIGRLR